MAQAALTDEQCEEALAALKEYGTITEASTALGIPRNTFNHRVKKARERSCADAGMIVTGRSTLRNAEGAVVMEWEKTSLDREREEAIRKAAFEEMAKDLPRTSPIVGPPATLDNLATVYTLTDCHVGALAWHEEGGADWDLDIAERTLVGCFQYLVDAAPQSELGVVNQLGDFLHFDGLAAITPTSGHILDADGRFDKVVRVAIRILRRVIDMALVKHARVHVIMAEGNHDLASSVWLRQMMAALYENEPRVEVNTTPLPYYVIEWGLTMLAFHHGHLKKPEGAPAVFAQQYAPIWGRTLNRYCHLGHRHTSHEHDRWGMHLIQHPTLAARDSYASRHGWDSIRLARAITYCKLRGEHSRIVAKPEIDTPHKNPPGD